MFYLSRLFHSRARHIAAIDLGSNSFHLIVARWDGDQLTLLDRLRDPVRVGWGLGEDGSLSIEARERALVCLERFGECLRKYPSCHVRAVGTKTLRSMLDARAFLKEAQTRLGHPVEIISGEEEARLIYLGVAHCLAPATGKRLVVDIGGGSTEVILGEGMRPEFMESLNMGCVALAKKFFGDGTVTDELIEAARIACLQEISPVAHEFVERGWQDVFGASGTIKAVSKVCEAASWSDGTITAEHLDKIIQLYRQHGSTGLKLPGLAEDRQPVFLGGVLVLAALFESLRMQQMVAVDWALREGLLYDMKDRS